MKGYIAVVVLLVLCFFMVSTSYAYTRVVCPPNNELVDTNSKGENRCIIYQCNVNSSGNEVCVRVN